MKTRRMATVAVMAAAFLASPYARAATTNEVDIAALLAVADNGVETNANGWTLHKIGRYSEPFLHFNSKEDWILSPDFGTRILRLELKVRCSDSAERLLTIVDEATGKVLRTLEACVSGKSVEYRNYDFDVDESFSQFRLKMTDNGSAQWGVGEIKVIMDDPVIGLCVSRKGGNWCELLWENGEGTVSNRVDTLLVERGAGEEVIFQKEFDNFIGNQSANKPVSDDLTELLGGAFSGVNVYALGATNGICLVGQGKKLGILRYAGCADYTGVCLSLTVKCYPGDNAETKLAYELNGETNVVTAIDLTEDFVENVVDLGAMGVPDGAAILIGYYDTPSNRRVLIDSMSMVRTHPDTLTPIDCRWIPASPGAASFSTRDYGIELLPKSEYRFEVRSKTAGVLVSDPAAVDVVLDSPPGFRFILR